MVWDAVRRGQRVLVAVPHNLGAELLCTDLRTDRRAQGVVITRLGDERRMSQVNEDLWLTNLGMSFADASGRRGKPLGLADAKRKVLEETRIFCCTATYAGVRFEDEAFGLVIVDAAGTCPEPALTGLMSLKANCRVLVGDDRQLGPVLSLPEARHLHYHRSMLTRMSELGYPTVTLE